MFDYPIVLPSATSLVPDITPLTSILQYEMWFKPPSTITGTLTVTIVAQLGPDATAGDWKVDLYEWVEQDKWINIGDLTGG